MTIRAKTSQSEIVIDLTGPDGNAFALMGHARSYGRQLDMKPSEIDDLIEEMMAGDYEHLVETFDNAFGEYIILER